MAAVHVLDKYYLSITFLITLAYQLFFFLIAFTLQFDKLTDFAGGTNFVLLGILTLCFSEARTNARNIVASVLLIVWAARLAGFLLFRILNTGVDHRFDEMRRHFVKFGAFWVLQLLWVWSVSLPVIVLNSPGVTRWGQPKFGTGRDIAGVVMFAVGFVMEAVADAQRFRFRERHGNDGRTCQAWFFSWSRHPSYFGEIVMHFGMPSETRKVGFVSN
jgi:steroid 5-alpha reductase family enzyme